MASETRYGRHYLCPTCGQAHTVFSAFDIPCVCNGGTSRPHHETVEMEPVAVIPLAEHARLVARVAALEAALRDAIDGLDSVREATVTYRSSGVEAVVVQRMGELRAVLEGSR